MKSPYVFISYSTVDQKYADTIYNFLTENGINAWIATKDIHGGESFANEITNAIRGCKAFIFILSQNSDDSPHCGNELSIAFNERKKIIPFRLHEFNLSESNTYFLQQAQWIDSFKDEGASYNELLEKVSNALNEKETVKTTVKIKTAEEKQIENLVKRAYQALKEKDFDTANDFVENILNINMEYAEAYLIKFLCDLKLKNVEQLKKYKFNITNKRNLDYAKQYANEEFLKELEEIETEQAQFVTYNFVKEQISKPFDYDIIKGCLETELLRDYKDCDKLLNNLSDIYDQNIIKDTFPSVTSPYFNTIIASSKNSSLEQLESAEREGRIDYKKEINALSTKVIENIRKLKSETLRKTVSENYEKLLSVAFLFQDEKYEECIEKINEYSPALSFFDETCVNRLISYCNDEKNRKNARREKDKKDREERIKQEEIRRQNSKKESWKTFGAFVLLGIVIAIIVGIVIGVKENKYQNGKELMAQHRYEEAMDVLHNIDYKDSSELYFYCEDMIEGEYYNIVDKYNLTEFEIPDGVTEIKNYAFYKCDSLVSVNIPNSVTKIGKEAFYKCTSLQNVTIPDNVTSIGESAFSYCTKLTNVIFGENSKLTSIGKYVFVDCTSLKSIKIPSGVKIISNQAFNGCTALTEVALHNKLEEIGSFAFTNCSSLTKLIIPLSVETVGDQAVEGCSKLIIYCEVESKPSGWRWNWNYSKRPEVWGYKGN